MLELDSCAVDVNIPFNSTAQFFKMFFFVLARLVGASWLVTWHLQKLVYSVSWLLISFRCSSVRQVISDPARITPFALNDNSWQELRFA